MLKETKTEIQNFVLELMTEMSFEDVMRAVYREYPIFEHMGYALHVYMLTKQAERIAIEQEGS